MRQSRLLPLLQALLVGLLLLLWQGQYQSARDFVLLEGERPLPGTDWVVWANDSTGVIAQEVLPPATRNQRLGDNYVQPGDRLLAVDYRPVFTADVIARITRSAGPGSVLLYQLERTAADGSVSRFPLFVKNAYDPTGLHRSTTAVWTGGLIYHVILLVLGGFFIALLVPFLGRKFLANLSLLLLLLSVTVYSGLYIIRYGLIMVDYRFEFAQLQALLGWGHLLVLLAFGLSLSIMRIERWRLSEYALVLLQVFLLMFLGLAYYYGLQNGQFVRMRSILMATAWGYVFSVQGVYYLRSAFEERGRLEQLAMGGGATISLVLFFAMSVRLLSGNQLVGEGFSLQHSPVLGLVASFSIMGPLVYTTASVLRFGKVSVVLRRLALVLLGGVLLVLIYTFANWLLGDFARGSILRTLLIVALMIAFALVLRALFIQPRFGLSRYLALPTQRRAAKLGAFISRIPRYTSSAELLHDVRAELLGYFRVQQVIIWLPETTDSETNADVVVDDGSEDQLTESQLPVPTGLSKSELKAIGEHLVGRSDYWSRSRELAGNSLPGELDRALSESGWRLAFPLHYTKGESGIVFFGRRSRGVFTLEDVEQIQRLLTQTQLTLEILRLLEKEKVLVRRTLEANMAALRSQINPHFLFNTLNTISALVHDSPDLAESAVEKLAYIFRHTLKFSNENFVPLNTELQLVETYLEIEKIRFGDRLTVEYDFQESCLMTPLPTLVLQTIVENCIKHGIARIIEPGIIRIRIKEAEPFCLVTVYDNGPGIDQARIRKGTGLKNTIDRMHDLYNHSNPVIFENTGDGTLVTLKLPKQ